MEFEWGWDKFGALVALVWVILFYGFNYLFLGFLAFCILCMIFVWLLPKPLRTAFMLFWLIFLDYFFKIDWFRAEAYAHLRKLLYLANIHGIIDYIPSSYRKDKKENEVNREEKVEENEESVEAEEAEVKRVKKPEKVEVKRVKKPEKVEVKEKKKQRKKRKAKSKKA